MRQILIEKYIQPSKIEFWANFKFEQWHDRDGELHSFMGHPASVDYNITNKVISKSWYKKGKEHRDKNLPAFISYYNERMAKQVWYKNNIFIKEEFYKIK